MNAKQHITIIFLLILSILISGCGPGQLFGPAQFVSIAAGESHACGLTKGGGVKCWGNNEHGQLGDGTIKNRTTPVDVIGLGSRVTAIATGGAHTCALLADGVKCWGSNGYGQLGDGTSTDRLIPVDVSGLTSGVSAVATGYGHTCALTASGGVKCWGLDGYGQLGDGSIMTIAPFGRNTPVDVSGLTSGVSAIAAGQGHSCALMSSGGVKCWGYNEHGQLGDGAPTTAAPYAKTTPVDVSGLTSQVRAIAIGSGQTCVLTTASEVKCWGTNAYGELGDGTVKNRATPLDVKGLTGGIGAITTGYQHSCVLTTSGGVKCWGGGQSTNSAIPYSVVPVDMSGLPSGISAIAGGHDFTCVLTSDGGVKCWGLNGFGQLGDGTTTDQIAPIGEKH